MSERPEQHLPEPEFCTRVLWPGTSVSPPEYCENEAMEGEEFCEVHIPWWDDYFEDKGNVFLRYGEEVD